MNAHHQNDQVATGSPTTMPTFYIPHGAGPCFFMDWQPAGTWRNMEAFLRGIADTLPARPRAIVLVSGHWLTPRFTVTAAEKPELIYDYYGFPPHTYEIRYPALGDPGMADQVESLLRHAGLAAGQDGDRGFDHGVFIPLKLVFPDADIPVIQLSLRQDLDPMAHLDAGRALRSLREEGVLIIGSGMSFHNMRGYGDSRYTPVSAAFDEWLTAAIEAPPSDRLARLAEWEQAPYARHCHPAGGEEHLLPLMVAAGASGDSAGAKVYSETIMETTISAFRFG